MQIGISIGLFPINKTNFDVAPAGFAFVTAMNPTTGNRENVTAINPSTTLREPIAVRIPA